MQSSGPRMICNSRCSPGASDRLAYCSSATGCCRNTIASSGASRKMAICGENNVASPTQKRVTSCPKTSTAATITPHSTVVIRPMRAESFQAP